MLHCNSVADLAVGRCPAVEENRLRCAQAGSVEERIDHLVQRMGVVTHTDWASFPVVEETQGLALGSQAQPRSVVRQHMMLGHKRLHKDRVLHFQPHLSQG